MKTMTRSHCPALDKKENATNWFTALATANKLFKQFTATYIPPSSILTSSELAMLRKVVQIGTVQASFYVVVVVSVFKSIRFRCSLPPLVIKICSCFHKLLLQPQSIKITPAIVFVLALNLLKVILKGTVPLELLSFFHKNPIT